MIHAARQPHLPGDGRHRLPEERRHARKGGAYGEPCLDTHDATLRPPRRGSDARRGGTDTRLSAPEALKALADSTATQADSARPFNILQSAISRPH
jgi:hypothetical protein